MKKSFILTLISFLFIFSVEAQLRLPQSSPQAAVSQTIGLTDVSITYHTPGVKGRVVWGNLVPYGQIWRCGANESTLISFSDDVKILGVTLPAGTYSLFVLPQEDKNWQLIFNKNTKLWGTEGYNSAEDALRVPVKPIESSFHENLQYSFNNLSPRAGTLFLSWEKLSIPVTIEVEVFAKALSNIKADLSAAKADDWTIYAQAAQFLIQHNTEHQLALDWINKSLQIKENFYNSWLKAQLLAQKNEFEQAVNLTKKALKLGKTDEKNFTKLGPEIERSLEEWRVKSNTVQN
ncbi:DUF2911 domain-containing protein [Adhaeribacter aquaticus]|uniref:DUF2911 domain-containing protein n=1 Tax=Adhaeribacter aquaticus TaxID=299567 RepID=UPI000409F11A|nr:DUF2911 domain-containing protein [Adhaeribacter aquaticus]